MVVVVERAGEPAFELEVITNDLPADIDTLRAEAIAEGHRHIERLATEWKARTMRFDREDEALLTARLNGVLAGIGGMTIEPVVSGALRMRRLYVRPPFRRRGVARNLVTALLARVAHIDRRITVNAGAGSAPFWESLGFAPEMSDGHTHVLQSVRLR